MRGASLGATLLILSALILVPRAHSRRGDVDGWQVAKPADPRVARWTRVDRNIHAALFQASRIFNVSYSWLHACNHSEGGHLTIAQLRVALRTGAQPSWNHSGSRAFGPMQFMLAAKPAPLRWPFRWGTYGAYMYDAFRDAHRRGSDVPTRFRRPDSNVGQAIVAAYMFSQGHSGQWTGAGC